MAENTQELKQKQQQKYIEYVKMVTPTHNLWANMAKAIIMDGNRRWAREKGLETKEGHKAGADNLEKIAKDCNELGVKYLTVYAFSTENWKRSQEEVSALMILLRNYLKKFSKNANKEGIRIKI